MCFTGPRSACHSAESVNEHNSLGSPGNMCSVVRAQRKGSDEVKEFGWHVRFKFSVPQPQLNSTAGLVMPIKHPYRGKVIALALDKAPLPTAICEKEIRFGHGQWL